MIRARRSTGTTPSRVSRSWSRSGFCVHRARRLSPPRRRLLSGPARRQVRAGEPYGHWLSGMTAGLTLQRTEAVMVHATPQHRANPSDGKRLIVWASIVAVVALTAGLMQTGI